MEGLGPILKTFCTELATYKDKDLTKKIYRSIISDVSTGSDISIQEILGILGPGLMVSKGSVTHVQYTSILPVILNLRIIANI